MLPSTKVNTFEIDLLANPMSSNAPSSSDKNAEYDEEYEDINSLLADLCEMLANEEGLALNVKGFGDSSWPVDIGTDLSCILEQLPHAIKSLKESGEDFELSFYEQGIERMIHCHNSNETVEMTCRSGTEWEPSPSKISIDRQKLLFQLEALKRTFKEVAIKLYPKFTKHPWFTAY